MAENTIKNRDNKRNEQKAIAFGLGRLANEFEFYLRQAVALSVLPKEPYLHGYYEHLIRDRAMETLTRVERECALLLPAETSTFFASVRSELEVLAIEIAKHDIGRHLNDVQGMKDSQRVRYHSTANHRLVDSFVQGRKACLSSSLLKLIDGEQTEERIFKYESAYRLGASLDKCVHPPDVVEFMNLSWDPRIIALNSMWVFEIHGEVSRPQPELEGSEIPADLQDETWRIVRCFERGDILPSPELCSELVKWAKNCSLDDLVKYEVQKLQELASSTSWISFEDRLVARCIPEELNKHVEKGFNRPVRQLLIHPIRSNNRELLGWMLNQKRSGMTYQEIYDALIELEIDRYKTVSAVEKAIKRFAKKTGQSWS